MAGDLKRAIFIGVGGSGGSTLRFLYRELELRLAEVGWGQGIPDGWQFLHIDVAEQPDGITGGVPRTLVDPEHFIGIAREPLEMSAYLNMIPSSNPEILAGWSPTPGGDYGYLWLGAGQRRAVGRVVAMTQLAGIRKRIEFMQMAIASNIKQMDEVAKVFNLRADTNTAPNVYLIASLAGGSGSGVFLDVSMLLEAMDIHHATVLYGIDVFDDLIGGKDASGNLLKFDLSGNALGALTELVSAYEHEGPYTSADSAVLKLSGSPGASEGRRTTPTHFFIGRKGMGKFEFAGHNAVYHATARALTAITVNGDLAERMTNYVLQNSGSLAPLARSLLSERTSPRGERYEAAMSFGYAAVNTGREAFAMYASERLTRRLMAMIADDDAAVKKLRERENATFVEKARHFADQCGLREGKPGPNQISDQLRGGPRSVTHDWTEKVKQSVSDELMNIGFAKLSPSDVDKRIETNFSAAMADASMNFRKRLLENAQAWTAMVQPIVLQNVVTGVSRDGLGMTVAYLEQLEVDLLAAIDETRANATTYRNSMAGIMNQAKLALATIEKKVRLAINSDEVVGALEGRRSYHAHDLESHVLVTTASLISDFVNNFLKPLKQELKRARGQFQVDIERNGVKEEWSDWATGPVPERLQPSDNEVFLETTDTFSSSFDRSLQDALNASTPDLAMELATGEVFAGVWPGLESTPDSRPNARLAMLDERFGNQTRIVVTSLWSPTWSKISEALLSSEERRGVGSLAEQSTAAFRVGLDLDDLLRTAKAWTRERVGFKSFSQVTLGDYLYEPVPEAASRRARFAAALNEALQKAALMFRVDTELLQAFVGSTEIGVDVEITTIPVLLESENGKRTSEGDEIMGILTSRIGNLDPSSAEAKFDRSSVTRKVEIVCFSRERVHPFALGSIVQPIAQAWAQASMSSGDRETFWHLRRARTLASFVPVAPSVQSRLAKGWIIARFLNYIDQGALKRFRESNGQMGLSIYDPESTQPNGLLHFPQVLLDGGVTGVPIAEAIVFPAILESLPLAYLALANGSVEEVDAYKRLGALGGVEGTNELREWITSGNLAPLRDTGTCPVTMKSEWASLADAAARADAIRENLSGRMERLQPYLNMQPDMNDLLELDRAWEFRDSMKVAIELLENDVQSIVLGVSSSPTDFS